MTPRIPPLLRACAILLLTATLLILPNIELSILEHDEYLPDEIEPHRLPLDPLFTPSWNKCLRFFNDHEYAMKFHINKSFDAYEHTDDETIDSSCEEIKKRGSYPQTFGSKLEKEFPIAFVRVIFMTYHLQELLFNMMYRPQNFYCYALNIKSSELFHHHMYNLSQCFPNVFIANPEYPIDPSGHNMSYSYLNCLKILLKKRGWKYVILLQNEEIPIKTNYELVQILSALDGSNDIQIQEPILEPAPRNGLNYAVINLFKDPTMNWKNRSLRVTRGNRVMTLSREFVEFALTKLNFNNLVHYFEKYYYVPFEVIFSSLHSDDYIDAPGGFTRQCLRSETGGEFITVVSHFFSTGQPCYGREFNERICVFSKADMALLAQMPHMFGSKMLTYVDYEALACWAQYMVHRARARPKVNPELYRNLQVVRFNRYRSFWRKYPSLFRC